MNLKRLIHERLIFIRRGLFRLIKDLKYKGLYYTVIDNLYKFPFLKKILSPIVNALKPDFVIISEHKIFIDKKDTVLSEALLKYGKWEEAVRLHFIKNLKKGDVVLDIGAHIGYFSLMAAKVVGQKGKVYAFEPDNRNFQLLKKNILENNYKNIFPIKKAVTNKNGRAKLYIDSQNSTDHRLTDTSEGREFKFIQTLTLNGFFKPLNKRVDFIKIDIQGGEYHALLGASNILKENPGIKILTEFYPKGLADNGIKEEKFLTFLTKLGFTFKNIDEYTFKISKVSLKKLLDLFLDKHLNYTNLLCIKKIDKSFPKM